MFAKACLNFKYINFNEIIILSVCTASGICLENKKSVRIYIEENQVIACLGFNDKRDITLRNVGYN